MQKDIYNSRNILFKVVIILIGLMFILRLLVLQVIDQTYKFKAENTSVRKNQIHPARGLIYDRNGNLVVSNVANYNIMVIPAQVEKFDTILFMELLHLDEASLTEHFQKLKREFGGMNKEVFMSQVSAENFARFQEYLHLFPGFTGETETIRNYPYGCAAQLLGDIGPISEAEYAALTNKKDYTKRDQIGKNGLELEYEEMLKGQRGIEFIFVDRFEIPQGSFKDGEKDTLPVSGLNLEITLDMELQQYGEYLMQNKRGSIVAIEPETGEILSLVSSPAYDPNLLCGSERSANFQLLQERTEEAPLYNKAIKGRYMPGSTFKAIVGLIALQEGVIVPNYYYPCGGGYSIPGYYLRCSHAHASAQNMTEAIRHSCNPYFWHVFRAIIDQDKFASIQDSYDSWQAYLARFGLGQPLGIDLPGEYSGNVPDHEYYDGTYGNSNWKSTFIISQGIGQGELEITPLQLANTYAAIANRGYFVKPHIVKSAYIDPSNSDPVEYERIETGVDAIHFESVINGLADVVQNSSGRRAKLDSIIVCGKTGTVTHNEEDKESHSVFAAFAPKDDPKIAIAVVVEYGGYGSQVAAPIAGLMIEKYLTGKISEDRLHYETDMIELDLITIPEEEEEETEIAQVE